VSLDASVSSTLLLSLTQPMALTGERSRRQRANAPAIVSAATLSAAAAIPLVFRWPAWSVLSLIAMGTP